MLVHWMQAVSLKGSNSASEANVFHNPEEVLGADGEW
jgi:hypothetical protein